MKRPVANLLGTNLARGFFSSLLFLAVLLTPAIAEQQTVRIEPESASVMKLQNGTGLIETQGDTQWSGGQQLWWRDAKIGQSLELSVQVPTSGYYRVITGLTKAVDYGIFDFSIAGKPALRDVDCYSPSVKLPTPLTLAEAVYLDAGVVKISATVRGANPLAIKSYMLGWDYLDFIPIPQPVIQNIKVQSGGVPTEVNLLLQTPLPADWMPPVVWQMSDQHPDWVSLSTNGIISLAPSLNRTDSSNPTTIFAVARDSSTPQKSQPFLVNVTVKEPSLPPEGDLLFSETIAVSPGQSSTPRSVPDLLAQNPALNGAQVAVYQTSSNGQFQTSLQNGQFSVSALPHATPGSYPVYFVISDQQNPPAKKFGRFIVRIQPSSLPKPDVRVAKSITRGDLNQASGTLDLATSLGALGQSLVAPLRFDKLPDATGYTDGLVIMTNGSSVSLSASENQGAPESMHRSLYFLVTDSSVPTRKASVLVDVTVNQPSIPQDAPPSDRFSVSVPITIGSPTQPYSLAANLPQYLNLSGNKTFSLIRNSYASSLAVYLSPMGDLTLSPMPSATQGVYPVFVKVSDGARTVYGTLDIQLSYPSVPPTDFDVTVEAVIGQPAPLNVDLSSKTPPGFSTQSQWTVISNPSSASVNVNAGQNSLSVFPNTAATPGEYFAYLKVSDSAQGQVIEKFAKLRILLASSAPIRVDFSTSRDVVIGSQSSPINLSSLVSQTLGLQGALTFRIYSSLAPAGVLNASISPDGQLMLFSYQNPTSTVTFGQYQVYVAVTDSTSKTIYGKVDVQLSSPTVPAIDAETAAYHDLATPPQPLNLRAKLQDLVQGLPLDGTFFELFSDNAPSYLKRLDPSGMLALDSADRLQPGSQFLTVRASSPSIGVRFIRVWLHAVGSIPELQPTFQSRILASKVSTSQTISLPSALQTISGSQVENTPWTVDILDNPLSNAWQFKVSVDGKVTVSMIADAPPISAYALVRLQSLNPANPIQAIGRVLIEPCDFSTATILAHYDAQKNDSLIQTGGAISEWRDLSGNNYHLMAGPDGGPKASLLSGAPVVDFYPEKGLIAQAVPLNESVTIFMVIRPSTDIRTWGSYIHHGNHDQDWAIRMNGSPGSKTGFHSSNDNEVIQNQLTPDLSYVLVGSLGSQPGAYSDRRTYKVFRSDGTQSTISSSSLPKSITAGFKPLFVGKSDSNEASNAKIGEIIYYSSALSDSEISVNADYLISKWMQFTPSSGGGQAGGGGITPPASVQAPAQTVFRVPGATLDLAQFIPASLSLTPPFQWNLGNTQLPPGVSLSPSGEMFFYQTSETSPTPTAFTVAVAVSDASNPKKNAVLNVPINLADFGTDVALSAISAPPVQLTIGGLNKPVDAKALLMTVAQATATSTIGIDWSAAKLSVALVRGNGSFSAKLQGDTLSLETLPNAFPGAYDLFVRAAAMSATEPNPSQLFRIPVILNGPTQSNVDLVIARTVVRGSSVDIDTGSQVLGSLGLASPAAVEIINQTNLAAGLSVSSNPSGTITISAGASSDGIARESIFLKVLSNSESGMIEKFVRIDCSVSNFAVPAGAETFTAEISVPGIPDQELVLPLSQFVPGNILSDQSLKYRILDPSVLANKGIESLIDQGTLRIKPLTDFIPGKTQVVIEAKSVSRTVYGTLTVVQSAFEPPVPTFEAMVQVPIGGQLTNPINLAAQIDPASALAGQLPIAPAVLEVLYNASGKGITAYLDGTNLMSLAVSQTAYLGKNTFYIRKTDTTTGSVTFGKLTVNVLPPKPEQVAQEISASIVVQSDESVFDIRPLLAAPLADRGDLAFSLYSVEDSLGLTVDVDPDGLISLHGASAQSAGVKPLTVHLAAREIATGVMHYVTARLSLETPNQPSQALPAVTYLDLNRPACIIDLQKTLGLPAGAEPTSIDVTHISNPTDVSVKVFGRYAIVVPSTTAQPGIYSVQLRIPSSNGTQPSDSDIRDLILCAYGEPISDSSTAPYFASADWDSPSALPLVWSTGVVSLTVAANQASNFIRAELVGGAVKFYADRTLAVPGTYKVKITDPRSPTVQLLVNVSLPEDLFRPLQSVNFIAKREFLSGSATSVDLRSLFPNLSATSQYTFTIPSSLEGNPLKATVTPSGSLNVPGFPGQGSSSESEFSVVPLNLSWEQAREDAVRRGGHLATFSSESEWMKMLQQVGQANGLWLGASDQRNEGKWEWVTGEPWTYQNWANGEPNNCCGGENFLMVSGSQWNDAGGYAGGYILETPISSVYVKATDTNGASVLLRVDVVLKQPQSKIAAELSMNSVAQSIDLNALAGPLNEIGLNRIWELESSSSSEISLSPAGQLVVNVLPRDDHPSLTVRVRDLNTNKSVFVGVSLNAGKPQTLEIFQNPTPQTVNTGSRVLLTVMAESPLRDSSQLAFQWRRNGTPIPGAIFDAYSFTATNDSKGEYDVLVSDGASQKVSAKALVTTDDRLFAGPLSESIQNVVQAGSTLTLQQQAAGFKIRQVVLRPSPSLGSINTIASADLILSLPATDPRVASTYVLFAPTLNHYGDGDSGHYPGKTRLPASEPSYALKAEGTLFIPTEGVYTFGVNSDDGSRIVIDGVPVMVDDSNHGAQDFLSQPIPLTSGLHSVEVIMFEGGGGDHIEFYAAPGYHYSWNEQFSLVGSPQGLKVFSSQVPTAASTSTSSGSSAETVWFDEGWTSGIQGSAGELVQGNASLAAKSGSLMMKLQDYRNDIVSFSSPWKPSSQNGVIFFDMFIPEESPSLAFMLQVGSREGWEHRAVWGDLDQAPGWGAPNTNARRKVGELPPKGKWTRMQFPLSSLGITSADYVRELAFSQVNGLVYIDRVGFSDIPPFQWLKDGVAISGATSPILKLNTAQSSDSGVYSLLVTSSGASVSTSSVYIYVREALWDPSEIMHPLLAPANTQFRTGSPFKLAALVSGPGDVRYVWRKNGQILPSSANELVITSASDSDAGTYSVTAISDSILRTVEFAPVQVAPLVPAQKPIFAATSGPRTIQIPVGAPLNLTDAATGSDISYSWTKNGQPLPGFQTNSLFIPLATVSDAGQYALIATNSGGSAVSEPFNVTVATPPVFTESGQPKPLSLIEGDSLQLAGIAIGAASYQWYLNGIELPGATLNSYIVLKASSSDAGTYKLVATSSLGLKGESQAVKVDVFSRPSIRLQPQPRFVDLGAKTVFSVDATGSGTLAYKWLKNNAPIANSNGSVFIISAAAETDVALYSVEVSSPYGTVTSSSVQLAIKPTLTAAGQPQSPVIRPGDSFSLNVSAVGTGSLSYQWFKNGSLIQGATERTFTVAQSSIADEGQYFVEVRSPYGSVTSNIVPVGFLPVFVTNLQESVSAAKGSDVLLSTAVVSSSPVNYQWSKDGMLLPSDFPVFFESFSSYQGIQNASQAETGLKVAFAGSLAGWTHSGANAIHGINRKSEGQSPDWAVMIYNDNTLVSPEINANAIGKTYRVTFELAPTVYAALDQQTQLGDAVAIGVLRRDGSELRRSEHASGKWAATAAFTTRAFEYKGDGTGPIRIRMSAAQSMNDGRFKGAIDNLSLVEVSLSGPELSVKNLQEQNVGLYRVTASNAFGSVVSKTTSLKISYSSPAIKSQPQPIIAPIGAAVALFVDAQSDLAVTYQWFRDGSPTGTNDASLSFAPLNQSHLGEYFVVIRNAVGEAVSQRVRVDAPPTFVTTQGPSALTSQEGQALTLSSNFTGSVPMTFQWFKNGQAISGATSQQLVLQAVTARDAGEYVLEIRNALGTQKSPPQTVDVLQRLKILSQPASVTANTGTPILLSVNATSSFGPIKYQWRRNSRAIPGATFPIFGIEQSSVASQGLYDVVVSDNSDVLTSAAANLVVSDSFKVGLITSTPHSVLRVGESTSISVDAPANASVQWRKDGSTLSESSRTLSVNSPGLYDAVVTNASGRIMTRQFLAASNGASVGTKGLTVRQVRSWTGVGALFQAEALLNLPAGHPDIVAEKTFVVPQLNLLGDGADGRYGNNFPLPLSGEPYVIRATGTILIPETGYYTFGLNSDDGGTIRIDGKPVMIDDSNHGPIDNLSQGVSLTAGAHSIEVIMWEGGGGDEVELFAAKGVHSGWNENFRLIGADDGISVTTDGSDGASRAPDFIKLLRVPVSIDAFSGQPISVSAYAISSSASPVRYNWTKGGDLLGGISTSTLFSGKPAQVEDAGSFRLTTMVGDVESSPVDFSINISDTPTPPQIVENLPSAMNLAEGTQLLLSARVVGSAPLSFEWFKDGKSLNAKTPEFGRSSVTRLDAGTYSLKVANPLGEITVGPVSVSVTNSPIRLVGLPSSARVGVGSPVTFTVEATGSDLMEYQWSKNGSVIAGQAAPQLKIPQADAASAGVYEVRVSYLSNPSSSVTATATLAVEPLPQISPITTQPASPSLSGLVRVKENSVLSLSVNASGSGPFKYVWSRSGTVVGDGSADFVTKPLTIADSGLYSVRVESPFGFATAEPIQVRVISAPRILKQPKTVAVREGSPLNVGVEVQSTEPLTYRWSKETRALENDTTSVLRRSLAKQSDAGTYTVSVSDGLSEVGSEPIQVAILPEFDIKAHPASVGATSNQDVEFFVVTDSVSPLRYQWLKNGTEIPGAIAASLRIKTVSADDAGDYSVRITSSLTARQLDSNVAKLIVDAPLAFTRNLDSQPRTVALNEVTPFEVQVSGSGSLRYKWEVSDAQGPWITQIATGPKFSLLGSPKETSRQVRVTVTNGGIAPLISNTAVVNVADVPAIVAWSVPQTARVGARAEMSLSASGAAVQIAWSKGGVPITPSKSEILGGITKSTLSFAQVSTLDAGTYTATVTSSRFPNVLTRSFDLTVNESPFQITKQPSSLVVKEGQAGRLSLGFESGSSDLSFQWKKGGIPLPGQISPVLNIFKAKPSDEGTYTVEISSSLLQTPIESAQATITVETAPSIVRQPETLSLSVRETSSASIEITAKGSSDMTYQWYTVKPSTGAVRQSILGAVGQRLELKNITPEQGGLYWVEVSNALGSASSDRVKVDVVPALNITSLPKSSDVPVGGTATLSVSADSLDPDTLRYQWYKLAAPEGSVTPYESRSLPSGVKAIPGADRASLLIESISEADTAEYLVEVVDSTSRKVARGAVVRAITPPSATNLQFSARPETSADSVAVPLLSDELIVGTGNRVSLKMSLSGSLPSTVTVLTNGQAIATTEATTPNPTLDFRVLKQHQGNLKITISNIAGTWESTPIKLSISDAVKILTQPQSTTADAQSRVEIAVTAIGVGKLTYRWSRNGTLLSEGSTPRWVIPRVAGSDAGIYQVRVSDGLTSELSTGAVLELRNVILLQPQPVTAKVGQRARLKVELSSDDYEVQWLKSGVTIEGATKNTLEFASVLSSDFATYQAVITHRTTREETRTAEVAVTELPDLANLNVVGDQQVRTGSALTLAVSPVYTAALPGATYQWFRNFQPIAGAVGSSLILAQTANSDAGVYTVKITSTLGSSMSKPFNVAVTEPDLLFSVADLQVTSTTPSTINLNSFDKASVGFSSFELIPNSNRLSASVTPQGLFRLSAPTGLLGVTESFDVKVFGLGGLYLGKGRITASVPAGAPPIITQHPATTGVPRDGLASITVQASGGSLRYQWRLNETNILGANAPILAAKASSGRYDCVVSNEAGSIVSAPASVFEVDAPLFTAQPASIKGIAIGSSAALWVSVSSTYPVSFQWFKDGIAITGQTSRVLNIAGFTPADEGSYYVTATNKFGVFSQSDSAALALTDSVIRIIAQPQSQSVLEGTPVTLQVVAKGPQPLSYAWFRRSGSESEKVGDSRTLELSNSVPGTFVCEVSSPSASTVQSVPATIKFLKSDFAIDDSKLADKRLSVMDSLSLGVSIVGEGSFSYQWMKDGSPIDSAAARRDTFVIQQVKESDAGAYSVRVSNGSKSLDSTRTSVVSVAPPLVFVTQPTAPQEAYAGDAAIELVALASDSTSVYQWRKNGVAIPSATSNKLTIRPQGASDSGTYDVIASTFQGTKMTGRAASQSVFVKVIDPLRIITQPKAVTANPGDGIALEVVTDGGSPTFQWFFKKSGLTTATPIEGKTLSRLEIPTASVDDEGSYYATIKTRNQTDLTTSPAFVRINKPVTITRNLSPTPVTLGQGKTMTLQVTASGTLPIRYQWRKDGVPISNATNQRLIITNSKSSASATYDCVITNVVGPVNSIAVPVIMSGRLEIATQPTPATVLNLGETFTTAITLANPTGTEKVQWYRTFGKSTRAVTGANSLTLSISNVQEADEAAYFAVVSGQVRLTSKIASLRINKPIRFITQPAQDITIIENKDLVLSVKVSGTSTKEVPITYQWSYNGQEIPGARSSSLLIKNAKVSASGVYSVTASNIVGKVTSQDARVTIAPGASFGPIYAIVNGTRRSPQAIITENPSSVAVPVKFKLATDVAAGDFVVEYHWRLNGRRILSSSAETSILDFDSLGNAEAGTYDVVVTTKTKQGAIVEDVTLDAVQVVVNEPVVVTKPPLSQGSNSGAHLQLEAKAKGAGLTYQWMKFNSATNSYELLPGANSSSLPITLSDETQGKYKVAFNGVVNQVSLSEINVWLLDSITIDQQPENITAIAGSTATLTVGARRVGETTGDLSYRWRKNRSTTGIVGGKITSIDVVQPGSGYRQKPMIEIVATGQGTGATADAVMELDASGETFSVASINVTNPGTGYDSAPEVRIIGTVEPNAAGTIGRKAIAGIFAAASQQSSPELIIPNVSEADSGEYYVEVFDGPVDDNAPRLTSALVNLIVQGKATIEMQPTLLTAVEGLPFDINVVASGHEAVFQWTKSSGSEPNFVPSQIITEAPAIHFPALKESDAGIYTLTVSTSNPPGTALSKEIQLKVIALPKELTQPEPLIERNPLESFYIAPQISSAPQGQTFFYQWFRDDREIVGAVGRTLFINQATESDEGRYRLEVYSEAGTLKSSPIDLSINDVPRVITSPENLTVEPDAPFSLTVSAVGKDLSYQWFLNGVAVPDATASTLTVDRAINGQTEGTYSVIVTSSTRYGGVGDTLQTSAKASVIVKDPTSIVKQPAADEVSGINLNASRTWTVEAQGTNLKYQWQKNGTDILGATQKSYRVGDAQTSDEGVYRVIVTGDLGVAASADFILEINKPPTFISHPSSVSAVAGGVIEVPADVTGSSPLIFQWRKDGRPLAGQTGSSLKLTGASTSDAGNYDVVVSNPVGTIRSTPFRVTIVTPPQITTQPNSVVVIPGESPALFVIASGAGPLSYQWFKDGEPIADATSSQLLLTAASSQTDGRYAVSVSNAAGSAFSQPAKVTVLSPVVITSQPAETRVLLKSKATLSVEVSEASLPVSYQWRKNGVPIAGAAAQSRSLSIASVQQSDAGEYDVIVTNDAGSVTSLTALLIIDSAMLPPTLPAKLTVNQGSGTSISVEASGVGPFTYQWRRNGQNIVGATEDVLVFEFASVTDSGLYDVVVSNPSGSVTSSKTELQVAARIKITKQPDSIVAAANDSVSLSIEASANGPLSYQWRKNGVNLAGANQPRLSVKVSSETTGVYDVLVFESGDPTYSILSSGASIDLSNAVKIITKPQSIAVFQGDGAAFDVIATGSGTLTYAWSLAGKVIPSETGYRLVIPQATSKPPATMTYSVTVSDGKTSETATATLTIRPRPSTQAAQIAAQSVGDAAANIIERGAVRAYSIEARPVAGAPQFDGRLYLDAETESAVVSDLTGGLTSAFRAPETGVTLTPALTPGGLEVLKLEYRSNSGLESWSLQGPANLVATQGDGSWMAHTLVGLRKVYDSTGKILGTWMVSVQYQESAPALPPATSGSSSGQ